MLHHQLVTENQGSFVHEKAFHAQKNIIYFDTFFGQKINNIADAISTITVHGIFAVIFVNIIEAPVIKVIMHLDDAKHANGIFLKF